MDKKLVINVECKDIVQDSFHSSCKDLIERIESTVEYEIGEHFESLGILSVSHCYAEFNNSRRTIVEDGEKLDVTNGLVTVVFTIDGVEYEEMTEKEISIRFETAIGVLNSMVDFDMSHTKVYIDDGE